MKNLFQIVLIKMVKEVVGCKIHHKLYSENHTKTISKTR